MKNDNIDPQVFDLLDGLKPIPLRDPHAAARGRRQFLSEAVSLREKPRHSGWMIFPYKETFAMKIVISAFVIVGLLFGGSATVSAAQDDLPNQHLYQIKLMSEDVQLWFVSDPVQQINMLMDQAQERTQEMQRLAADSVIPPADVAVRAQERIQRALQIASQLDEASQLAALQQIRTRLQTQEQQMIQLEQGTCTECIPVLKQTREMLQLHLRQLQDGPITPGALQNQIQDQTQMQNQDQLQINQTPAAVGTAIAPCGTCIPALDGTGYQNGSGTPSVATPAQQQSQTQQQQNEGGGGTRDGAGPGGGGSSTGPGGGSSTGNGGPGGKP
jgi:uncharacterized membrane protein YgcG